MKSINIFVLTAASVAFLTGNATGAQAPVELGTAGDFAILSQTGISATGVTSIIGDPVDWSTVSAETPTSDPYVTKLATSLTDSKRFYRASYE